ncbi:Very-long-chain, variant 3 [Schistosoma haematobium]|uniref:Very-long-chain, variant 3 n=1 Tax=Schistosoma haematobium TaxID=6185 RepID=A0A922LJ53_SCHHA|nr:Very-long-chain, variant 3 [Schistosoma haematobium]KAH9587126.1 Very-long-chain, variant 3 [Schistosoma haematobium]
MLFFILFSVIKNPLTIYLFLFNVIQFAGYLYVCGALVYGLMQYKEVHKIPFYEWIIDRLVFVQILSILEPLHASLGWIRGGSALPSVFQDPGARVHHWLGMKFFQLS